MESTGLEVHDLGDGTLAFTDHGPDTEPLIFGPYRPPNPLQRKSIRERWEEEQKKAENPERYGGILEAANYAVSDRHKKNDIPERNFARIAKVWSALLDIDITPEQVALMMVGLKVVREAFTHQFDNLVDIVGYTLCLEEIASGNAKEEV